MLHEHTQKQLTEALACRCIYTEQPCTTAVGSGLPARAQPQCRQKPRNHWAVHTSTVLAVAAAWHATLQTTAGPYEAVGPLHYVMSQLSCHQTWAHWCVLQLNHTQ
jgi:hypothetical protein